MKPSVLTVAAGTIVTALVTLLVILHDPVPQWMPYLAVFLFGHGVGAAVPSSVLAAISPTTPASTSTTTTTATRSTAAAVPSTVPAAAVAAVPATVPYNTVPSSASVVP